MAALYHPQYNAIMPRISLLNVAHQRISGVLGTGDLAIDATIGNGHDTVFLLNQVAPAGQVFGFDLQPAAIASTWAKVSGTANSDCLTLIQASHALMGSHIPLAYHGKIKAIMFNLGYLPGSDKSIITQADTTIMALNSAAQLLTGGGIITVMAYPGHPGGGLETAQVESWCQQQDQQRFATDSICSPEQPVAAPRLLIISKQW
ncbi:MAG: class I SAM-dependent methyltransferase [Methylococcales bacterium]|nr:class I SAM-dependent methyltransferase [Methylococcales bacterium]